MTTWRIRLSGAGAGGIRIGRTLLRDLLVAQVDGRYGIVGVLLRPGGRSRRLEGWTS